MKRAVRRLAVAAVAFFLSLVSAGAAYAQRDVVEDATGIGGPSTPCVLGAATLCANYVDLGFYDAFYNSMGNARFYFYDAGVVGLGAPLPTTASLGGGTASFGDGNWYAPSLGAPLQTSVYRAITNRTWINWLSSSGQILFQFEIESFSGHWDPRDGDPNHYGLFVNGPGRPEGGLFAYNYTPLTDRDCFGGNLPLACAGSVNAGLRPPGVPEPAAWALMILGLGGVGAALRRRRAIAT